MTKLYLKTFLFTGIPYALIILGFDLADGNGFRVWKFLFMIFFFGITMSVILISFHKHRLKKNGMEDMRRKDVTANQREPMDAEPDKN